MTFVLTVGLVSYNISKNTISSQVSKASLQTVVQASEKLDFMFRDFETISSQIQTNTELMDQMWKLLYFEVDQDERVAIHRKILSSMNLLLHSNPNAEGIYLLNEKGSFGTSNQKIPTQFMEQDWYKKTIEGGGKFFWLASRERGYLGLGKENTQLFAVAQVLKNSLNETVGVLLIEFDANLLSETLDKVKLESGNVLIRESSGQVVASTDPSFTDQVASLKLDEAEGQFSIKANGMEALVVYKVSDVTNWSLIGFIPKQFLYAEANYIFRITVLCAISAALLAVVIGYLIVRRVGRPLIQIRDLMQTGAKGNLTVKSDHRSKDEIGQLGNSFNEMIEKITSLISDTSVLAGKVLHTANEIVSGSDKTSTSAKEIAMATESIASGAGTLAEEAMRSNEITQNTQLQLLSVAESNSEISASASEVMLISNEGIHHMSNLMTDTYTAEDTLRTMADKMGRLQESTGSIEKIIQVMEQINNQTNILSLNAAIEASRVGAAGKGFMVVAQEMRSLASQSRESIQVVSGIIHAIQEEITGTVSSFLESRQIYSAQVNAVKEANAIFQSVHDSMEHVISKLGDSTLLIQQLKESQTALGESIGNVSAVSQQASAVSEEVASQSSEQLKISRELVGLSTQLKQLSDALKESLSKFKISE
ncbi:methyl-accepting chemotaxis protein [Paenibacillus validus]|uniref:methyl-accepting chemotaxis protein n=1 Tax=Paenibacillus validus TaxID=44253 RepID=UPI003D2A81A0